MLFFTSICANYLAKAIVLAESVKQHCENARFIVCLVEREIPQAARDCTYFDDIVLSKDIGLENFHGFMFRHTIVEAATAVKPKFFLYLLEQYPETNQFIYLDPDVLVYGDFFELRSLLQSHSIIVAPHLLRPGNIEMEISSLVHGAYNLGFLAISRNPNSMNFLHWWNARLFSYCYNDKKNGIFTDQKWIDLAPGFFEVHILKHHGYDFATWSLMGSILSKDENQYWVNGDRLRFVHYSGVDSGVIDHAMEQWLTPENSEIFRELYAHYLETLNLHGQRQLATLPWSYRNYESGSPISSKARRAYRNPAMWEAIPNPFASDDRNILKTARKLSTWKKVIQTILIKRFRKYGVLGTLRRATGKLRKLLDEA